MQNTLEQGIHSKENVKNRRNRAIKRDFRNNWAVYLMALPVVVYLIIFHYIPMGGVVMAFENYKIKKGILGSQWIWFDNFIRFFNSIYFWRLVRNTILISVYGLIYSFPFPIIFALCLNEIKNSQFKKLTQTISYLPYFISTVVIVSIINDFCKASGALTQLARLFGDSGGALISRPEWFRSLYIGSNLWQHLGYNSIIYISALATVDQELYEAAYIDGAGRWRQTLHVTLPGILPTIVILLIMRLGQMMNVGYEKTILMYSPATYETADIISSYVYRVGIVDSDYAYSTAVNLFNSLINFMILFVANKISRSVSEISLW